MAQGPEANLWRTMRQNLPEGALAERIENRHGGGMSDILLIWGVITFLIELKAPKTLPKKWFEPLPSCDHTENSAAGDPGVSTLNIFDRLRGIDVNPLNIFSGRLLSPEQIAFHARVQRAGGLSFILARPQDTRNLELFTPILGPAAPGPRPEVQDPGPAAPGSVFHVEQSPALRLPAEGPALRLGLVSRSADWPTLFAALRLRACDHIRSAL
jgi:hypothetical protein